ncbi:T9SS type A sorting domain-containing protein [Flavobacterium sp.]|uniref:T9SS type A sorting domain-containing protein n=1 Tax=Flavobacterium sp. TaxID=239 RepID=UPI00286D056B|nr:T9SS type A sorting domain-containing protein [Flavobacterium sp.]
MKTYLILFMTGLFCSVVFAQAPCIEWQKTLGGTEFDSARSILQTPDGGYIVAGSSISNNGDVSGNHGGSDVWVVKLSSLGDIIWQKSLGGSGGDYATSIQLTTDEGYIVAGSSSSTNGDISGNHGDSDFWVVKLSPVGNIVWQKSLGGTGYDYATSIQQTSDDGYIVAGISMSNNGDASGNHGSQDYWVVKLSSLGDIVWQKSLGGTNGDYATSIQQTSDHGYIVAGGSDSNNGDASGNHGSYDFWVVKLSSEGDIVWQKSLGGTDYDNANSIQQTSDGEYIVVGQSMSNNGDVSINHGSYDFWVVKLSSLGDIVWKKCLGGTNADYANSIQQTTNGEYIVAGRSYSNDGDIVSGHHEYYDFWVILLNSSGTILAQKSLGGSGGDDVAYSVQQTTDGMYVIAGGTSSNDGDVSGNHGNEDFWVVKLNQEFLLSTNEIQIQPNISMLPNPSSNYITFQDDDKSNNNFKYIIVDASGKVAKSGHSKFNEKINIQSLTNGNYIIQIEIENGEKKTEKLIKN